MKRPNAIVMHNPGTDDPKPWAVSVLMPTTGKYRIWETYETEAEALAERARVA